MGIWLTIMGIVNADALFAHFRIYKVFVILRRTLLKDCLAAMSVLLACLIVHGFKPEARAPGVAVHIAALASWALNGVQTSPLVSCALWIGGRNLMTKNQLLLRILAQVAG